MPAVPARTTVLCLHCSAGSAGQWQALSAQLQPRYRVLAPGLMGYRQGAPWRAGAPHTLEDEAAALEPLVSAAPGVHLVAHSFGAAVALRIALRDPRRVRSLVLYEPALFGLLRADPLAQAEAREIASLRLSVQRKLRTGWPRYAARTLVEYWGGEGAWLRVDPTHHQSLGARMPKVDAEFDALFGDVTPLAAYRRLRMPVLCLVGERARPPARRVAELLATVLPGVEHGVLAGAGHMGPITHRAQFDALACAFLDERDKVERRGAASLPAAA